MESIIIILISLVLFTSCKKENAQACFECSYAMVSGVQRPNDVRCTDGGEPPVVTDANGNQIGQSCNRR